MTMRQIRGRTLFPNTLQIWYLILAKYGDNDKNSWLERRSVKDTKRWWVWVSTSKQNLNLEPDWILPTKGSRIVGWLFGFPPCSHRFLCSKLLAGKWDQKPILILPILNSCRIVTNESRLQIYINNPSRVILCPSCFFQSPPSFLLIDSPLCSDWARWRMARRTT